MICVELSNGEKEILCTSLLEEKYTHEDIAELYHHRWGIEENYKLFKARAEVEHFSGKTARAVQQDFHAKVFMMTFCAVLAFPIEERVKKEYDQQGRYQQKINRTAALSMTGNISIALFLTNKIKSAIEAFDRIVEQTREIIRPNRKFERKKKPKKPYHINYKRL